MKQTISRTITTTLIDYALVVVNDGEPEFENKQTVLSGKVSQEQAIKKLQKEHKGETVTILSLRYKTGKYEMSLKEFIENSNEIKEEK